MQEWASPPHSIGILVEHAALSRWIGVLSGYLSELGVEEVVVSACEGSGRPSALTSLLGLEKLVSRRGRACWADAVEPGVLPLQPVETLKDCDLVIDLTGGEGLAYRFKRRLRPLYNSSAGEVGLASALFFEGTPRIELIESVETVDDSHLLAHGYASLEAAIGLGGAMEAVWSRVLVLLGKVLTTTAVDSGQRLSPGEVPIRAIRRREVAVRSAKLLASAAVRAAYRLCCHAPHWRVGWRMVEDGQDVWSRRDLKGKPWSVLDAPVDHFLADPFPVFWKGAYHLFFEDLPHRTQKGVISVCSFDDRGRPGPRMPVLEEPWHLSYPFLFEDGGDLFMIPESSLSGEIMLYKAVEFPLRWEKVATLVAGVEAADATIIRHQSRLWMFAVVRPAAGGYSDTLALWSADHLFGPWTPHAHNPVIVDDQLARPAGNMIVRNGQLLRPVQDCRRGYGTALNLMRVTKLDEDGFEQVRETHLAAGSPEWPGRKLHSLNRAGRLEAIDGSVIQPKMPWMADWTANRYRPRQTDQ